MKLYECNKCNKSFKQKSAYDCHMSRINPCIKDTEIKNICPNCNKIYSTKYNLKIHMNNCTKILVVDEKKEQIEELRKMLLEQQKKIEELSHEKETTKNITVNNTNTNSNNTTNNVINIYNVGNEDLSRLSKEEIIKICTSGTYYPLVAAEIIHCNEKYPEFQNFLITNLRSNDGLVRINDKWESKSQDEILSALLKVDKNHVSSLIKNLHVDDKLQIKIESTKDEIDTNQSKEHQKNKIKRKLYNASKMINKNKKKLDKTIED